MLFWLVSHFLSASQAVTVEHLLPGTWFLLTGSLVKPLSGRISGFKASFEKQKFGGNRKIKVVRDKRKLSANFAIPPFFLNFIYGKERKIRGKYL